MCNSSKVRGVLATITLAAGLAGCEDIPPKTATPRGTVAVEQPKPAPLPPPPQVVTPPPETKVEVGPTKEGPTALDTADENLPSDPLAGARKLLADGDKGKALKLAKLAVSKRPKRSATWNTLGRVQLEMGRREEALGSFEKAIELNPRNSYAHNNMGLALIYDGRYDEAVDELEQAVELEPVEGYMWNNLGIAYEHLDRLEQARDAYGKASELDSEKAKESLARLEGVKSVIRTAKVEETSTTR